MMTVVMTKLTEPTDELAVTVCWAKEYPGKTSPRKKAVAIPSLSVLVDAVGGTVPCPWVTVQEMGRLGMELPLASRAWTVSGEEVLKN